MCVYIQKPVTLNDSLPVFSSHDSLGIWMQKNVVTPHLGIEVATKMFLAGIQILGTQSFTALLVHGELKLLNRFV